MGLPELGRAPAAGAEDTFGSYVDQRLAEYRGVADPPETLPEELAPYSATLDRNGQWEYDASYGDVWYPAVAADWQPYGDGRWDRVGHYGWFWVGATAWSWPTHHYGRWGVNGSRWFWVPNRAWAPSWVSWAVGPGYVGWCALGQDNRPVVPFGAHGPSATYTRGRAAVGEDRWRGWHLVDRDGFESRAPVSHAMVNPRTLPHNVTASFVTQRVPPVFVRHGSLAVPRTSLPMSRELANQTILRRGPTPAREPLVSPPRDAPGRTTSPYERARPYMARPATRPAPPAPDGAAGAVASPPGSPDPAESVPRQESATPPDGHAQPRTTRPYVLPAARPVRPPRTTSPESPDPAEPSQERGSSATGGETPEYGNPSLRSSPGAARGERGSRPSSGQGGQRSDSAARGRVPPRPPR